MNCIVVGRNEACQSRAPGEPGRHSWPRTFVGIDLAGSVKRPTGFCLLRDGYARTTIASGDDDTMGRLCRLPPTLVGVDAPLFLPLGRCCLRNDCSCHGVHFRECDLELRRRGIRFFPITLGPMRQLTDRGIVLSRRLREMGHTVLETFPGAAQDVWGIPRQKDVIGLTRGLAQLVRFRGAGLSCHELDAITCALLARLHHGGQTERIGRSDEGWMVLPSGIGIRRRRGSRLRQTTSL